MRHNYVTFHRPLINAAHLSTDSTWTKDINSIMLLTSHLRLKIWIFFVLNFPTLIFDHPKSSNCFPFDLTHSSPEMIETFCFALNNFIMTSLSRDNFQFLYISSGCFFSTIGKHCMKILLQDRKNFRTKRAAHQAIRYRYRTRQSSNYRKKEINCAKA